MTSPDPTRAEEAHAQRNAAPDRHRYQTECAGCARLANRSRATIPYQTRYILCHQETRELGNETRPDHR